jgi:hypothetical protein
MRKWGMIIAIALLAAAIVAFWPASDPLRGVETVAIAGPSGETAQLPPEVRGALEIVLDEHRIRIVQDRAQADAVITIERLDLQDLEIRLSEKSYARLHAVVLVSKEGREYTMDLHVTLDEEGLRAKLVGRKPWEFWR